MLEMKNLNKEQKTAVLHGNGPLLLVAGAGTGKTTVITHRLVSLIERGKASPEEILAVTFTDKAAGEMEERVDILLPYGYTDLWISTFHSFCERILHEHALDIGLPDDFSILEETSSWLLVRKNWDRFNLDYYRPRGNPTRFIHALISHFSRCKDQGIYPEDYLEYSEGLRTNLTDLPEDSEAERIKEVAEAYHTYQKLLLENSALDFGDLINYCLKLFEQRPRLLAEYREKFKYLLVDEFQDTNWAQYALIKQLAAPDNNLTVCADDDQAIYRWRGASFNNIIQFKKDFPAAREIFLVENYRSRQNILDLSYEFIQANNPNRLEYVSKLNKKLTAQRKGKGIIRHLHYKSSHEEARGVAEKILEIMKKDKDADFGDFAILVRANNEANSFSRALEGAGIPYQFLASRGLYAKPVILDIISYFKLLDNYHESSAVYRILNLPFLGITSEEIMKITEYCRRKTRSVYEALQELPLVQGLSPEAVSRVNFLLSLISKHSRESKNRSVSEVMVSFLKDSGYLKYLTEKNRDSEIRLVNQFYKKLKEFEETSLEPLLRIFMEQMKMELESGEQGKLEFDIEEGPEIVRIMTIHAAKGLEFSYVFLVNMVDRRFPTGERKEPIEIPEDLIKEEIPEGDVHLQEERRLCYVAMTRAKRGLFFTSADDYGGVRKKKLSRFLAELGFGKEGGGAEKNPPAGGKESVLKIAKKQKETKFRHEILPGHFSFSQLVAFKKCPLQYKFAHILKVPVRGKASFSFGKSIHAALFEFVKRSVGAGNSIQKGLFPAEKKSGKRKREKPDDLSVLTDIYEKSWIGDWYETKQQKEEYHRLGREIIKKFYEEFSSHPPKILTLGGRLALELPFKIKIEGDILRGRIDRVDDTAEGIEVIDYKTGRFAEKLSPEGKMQLIIYQIALEQAFGVKPARLTYYYLEEGKKISFSGRGNEEEKIKGKITSIIKDIKHSDFSPTPGWQCRFCDFREICRYAQL